MTINQSYMKKLIAAPINNLCLRLIYNKYTDGNYS
jgi:hypothetical protein